MADKVFGIEVVEPPPQPGKQDVLKEDELYEVIEELMELDPAMDLEGIQVHGPNLKRVDVITQDLEVWTDIKIYSVIWMKNIY